jgi:hypothetical protein
MKREIVRKLILILIILIGAYFRLSHIELTKFSSDQGGQLQITKDGLKSGNIILAGCPSHLGIRHGAILQYLLTYPMILSDTPEVSIFFLALLSLVAIYMVYRIGNDFFSWRIGIIAAALFATSHVSITMARYLNNEPPLSPLFGALFIYALLKIVNHKSAFYSFVLPILTVILALAHSSNLTVIISLVIVFFLYRNSIRIKYALGGFFVGLIFLIPYFIYLQTNGFLKLNLLREFLWAHSNFSIAYNSIIDFRGPIVFLQIFGYNYPIHKAMFLDWLMAFLFLFGMLIFAYRVSLRYILTREKPYLRITKFPNETIVLISICTPLTILLFLKGSNPAYYIGQVPLMFVIVAVALSFIIARLKNRLVGYIFIFSIILFQAMANIDNWQELNTHGDSVLLKDEKAAVDFIIRDTRSQPFVISLSQNHIGKVGLHWLYLFGTKEIKPSRVKSIPYGAILYLISNKRYPSSALPIARFGDIGISKQKLTADIKSAFLKDLKYSFHKENGWELPEFDDSLWERISSGAKIPAKAEIIYIRAVLTIPEGIKYESVNGRMNSYLLDAYIDGKKINLSDSRFILDHGIIEGSLIKNLTHVEYENRAVDSLELGSYSVGLRILIPGQYFYLDTQIESPGFTVFNL